jgi:signal transduction histidine kinase
MRRSLSSLRARLTLSHLAVIVVAMGLSGFLLLSLLEDYFLEATRESLVAQAQITAQALVPGAIVEPLSPVQPAAASNVVMQQVASNLSLQVENVPPVTGDAPAVGVDLAYLGDASLQLSSELQTRIRIVDLAGIVQLDTIAEDKGRSLAGDPLVAGALAGATTSTTGPMPPYGQPAMHLVAPIVVDGAVAGAIYLSQPLGDVAAVLGDLRLRWVLSTVVALCLSALVGLLLARAVAQPLRRLNLAASAVARGDLDQKVPVRSRDELGQLSRTFNDMTERLRAARQMQADFVANVSHELRTPLTAVKGTVETLRDGAVDDPEVRDRFLETVEAETDRLIRLVNDLMVLSRADSEALNLRREPVDLPDLARGTVGRLAPQAEAKGLALIVKATPDLPLVLVDADRIEQVLVNLLDNAIKYSPPGRTVWLRLRPGPEGLVQVQVQDEGIGIPTGELDRIGERFYRTDRARSRAEGGTGLGLAIARALVEAHGGRLWLESGEGRGTAVTFTLPAA